MKENNTEMIPKLNIFLSRQIHELFLRNFSVWEKYFILFLFLNNLSVEFGIQASHKNTNFKKNKKRGEETLTSKEL